MLNWSETMNGAAMTDRIDMLRSFIADIFQPCLLWKAGRTAESIRTMATQAMCSMAQGAPVECSQILPSYAITLNELIDDANAITRLYALRTIMNSGRFMAEEYIKLAMSK